MSPVASSSTANWTRLVRFVAAEDSAEHLGQPCDSEVDVGLAIEAGAEVKVYEIIATSPWDPLAYINLNKTFTIQKILSPLSRSQTGTIRATGLSYKDHADEMGLSYPLYPVEFFKPESGLNDPNADVTVPFMCQTESVDWEVELAVVIGKECKDVNEEDALDYVLGYTVANDITDRKLQASNSQWCHAKGFDGFCPLGPTLVSSRALPNPHVLKLSTHVNGVQKQNGAADVMIFPLAKVVSFLSQGCTLSPGTVIITGTPPGIGVSMTPSEWLKDGDQVRCFISHGLGTLLSNVVYQKKAVAHTNGH